MTKCLWFIIAGVICFYGCKAKKITIQIENLHNVNEMPLPNNNCGDSIVWTIVKEGLEVIPFLIKHLDDTTATNAKVMYFGGNYCVGDVCNDIIMEIIRDFPVLDIVYELNGNKHKNQGYAAYYNYVRGSVDNRKEYKEKVKKWFSDNKSNLLFFEDNSFDYCPPVISVDYDAEVRKHPLGGYYKLRSNTKK